jgi:3-hydroxyisobutyrate dehydrogenase-like beta-hydroxyacid dehydrogenase
MSEFSGRQIGFIGLGTMGTPFAQHLLNAGHGLHVYDVRAENAARLAGATVHGDIASLAAVVDIVFLSLPTPDIVEDVVLGKGGLCECSVRCIVDLSTTGPDVSRKIAGALLAKGIAFVDAPVSGGLAGAKAASVAIMVACSDVQLSGVAPLLEKLGRIFHVGSEPGQGQIVKLLNNLLSAGSLLLAGEAASLGVKAGVDAEAMIAVFNAGSGRSSATLDKYPKAILPGSFSLGFTNRLMYKDVSLCLALADSMGLQLPTACAVRDEWKAAMEETGVDSDFSKIVLKAERRAGVTVRRKGAIDG